MEPDGELSWFSKDMRPRLARAAFKEAPDGGFSLERRLSQVIVLGCVHVDHKSVTNYSDGSQHESPDGETIHFVKPLFMELP